MNTDKKLNTSQSQDYYLVENAIRYIETHHDTQPSLAKIASSVNLSEFHFQKIFSRWVGISPKRFLQFLTKEYAKKLLLESRNVLDVTYDAGLSSPGRLHDLFIHCEAVTPGEFKLKGEGLEIIYGFANSPFGICLIAFTKRGICTLKFLQDQTMDNLIEWLFKQWPKATLSQDNKEIESLVELVFPFENNQVQTPLHLYIKGTNFQIKGWEALTKIPFGMTVTYQDIATHIGLPGANRAVGTAIGKNPVPFLIPCHRVIRKMGEFGNYGEGKTRKKAIIGWEASKREIAVL